jgi:uncharacterized protein YeaO (DUF488 family)
MVKIKRVYDPRERGDGERILVDRLWPRGLSRRAAAVDEWMKDLGPSHELRKWFGHRPERWSEFRRRYRAELRSHRDALAAIAGEASRGAVTLVFGARDAEHNQAVVLKGVIERHRCAAGRRQHRAGDRSRRGATRMILTATEPGHIQKRT